jgi:hypothetical protein
MGFFMYENELYRMYWEGRANNTIEVSFPDYKRQFENEFPPSTASTIKNIDDLRAWQEQESSRSGFCQKKVEHEKPTGKPTIRQASIETVKPISTPISQASVPSSPIYSWWFWIIALIVTGMIYPPLFLVYIVCAFPIFMFIGCIVSDDPVKIVERERVWNAEQKRRAIEEERIKLAEEARKQALAERQQRAQKEREERDRVQLHKLNCYEKLFALEAFEFEREIAKLHEKLGYEVEQTKATGDGGKDAIMWKNKTKYLLECKKYRTGNQVGRRDIQIFHSAILTDNAEGGFFVTTSDFSKEAREYVVDHKLNINLINMQGLSKLIEEATSIA